MQNGIDSIIVNLKINRYLMKRDFIYFSTRIKIKCNEYFGNLTKNTKTFFLT